jgi:predicted metal-binding membrane protein
MRFDDRLPGGILLIGAGLYQLTPLKRICLVHCRSPVEFLMHHWRAGYAGAFGMGLHHGAYCVGCCWFAMALLFVGGVMNLAWVAAIAAFVLAEKVLPFGQRVGQVAGVVAMVAGLSFIAASLRA